MRILINWIISAVGIMIAAYLIPGVVLSGFWAALIVALVLGLINTLIRPVLIILTLPISILTLGFFTLVINALLVMLTSAIVKGFYVPGFWKAMLFAIVLFFINMVLEQIKIKKY